MLFKFEAFCCSSQYCICRTFLGHYQLRLEYCHCKCLELWRFENISSICEWRSEKKKTFGGFLSFIKMQNKRLEILISSTGRIPLEKAWKDSNYPWVLQPISGQGQQPTASLIFADRGEISSDQFTGDKLLACRVPQPLLAFYSRIIRLSL